MDSLYEFPLLRLSDDLCMTVLRDVPDTRAHGHFLTVIVTDILLYICIDILRQPIVFLDQAYWSVH